jgi:hypothetical protein
MRLEVSLPIRTLSLNKLLRTHFRKRLRLKQAYQWELIAAGLNDPQYQVNGAKKRRLKVKSFRVRPLDFDNFIGGLKPFADALKEMSLIYDDGPEYLELEVEQEKVGRLKDQRTELILEDAV